MGFFSKRKEEKTTVTDVFGISEKELVDLAWEIHREWNNGDCTLTAFSDRMKLKKHNDADRKLLVQGYIIGRLIAKNER